MKELDTHFDRVCEIASAELDGANGCKILCDHLRAPFDGLEESQIESWVASLSRALAKKCWKTPDFKSSCKTHGDHLLYVAETGDVPQIISVGFPVMDTPHTFENIGLLAEHSTVLLPQLIENISSTTMENDPYFECTDLFHCYLGDLGLKISEIEDLDNLDASRLLVDSIAILSMIRSWRDVDPNPTANVYFCTSSGSYAFGSPIHVQIAR